MPQRDLPRVLTASLLVIATLAPAGCLGRFSARARRVEETAYPLEPGGRVELVAFNGAIRVLPSRDAEATIRQVLVARARTQENAEEGLDLLEPEVESDRRLLRMVFTEPRSWRHRFEVELEAWVPPSSTLLLRTSNGKVEVEGIDAPLAVHTSNGPVTVRDAGRHRVELTTSNGKILVEETRGDVQAHTRNGRVAVRRCQGRIEVSTANGDVEVDAGGGVSPGGIEVQSRNGKVRCLLPEGFSGRLDASTSNGVVRCDFPVNLEDSSRRRSRVRGTIGKGGPLLRLSTSNGGVEVRRSRSGPAPEPAREAPAPAREAEPTEQKAEPGIRKV